MSLANIIPASPRTFATAPPHTATPDDDSCGSSTASEDPDYGREQPADSSLNDPDRLDSDDVFFLQRIKRSDFQAVTNRAISDNPAIRPVLEEYFNDIRKFTHRETSRGRMLYCEKELTSIQDKLVSAYEHAGNCESGGVSESGRRHDCDDELRALKQNLAEALAKVDILIWGTGKN